MCGTCTVDRSAHARGLLLKCTSFPADPNFPGVVRSGQPWTGSCWTSCWRLRSFWPVFSLEPWRRAKSETADKLLRRVESTTHGSARLAGLLLGDFLTWAFDFLHSLLSEGSRGVGKSCFQTEVRGPPAGLETPVQMLECFWLDFIRWELCRIWILKS